MPLSRAALASVVSLACFVSSLSRPSLAADDQQCVGAYEDAQVLRRTGKLRAAREAAVVCARSTCPEVARKDCAGWVDTIQQEIPTVAVTVRDDEGHEVAAKVLIDGVPRDITGGRAFELDPGSHVFRAERAGASPVESTLTLVQGEHARAVRLVFPRPNPPPLSLTKPRENDGTGVSPRVTALVVLGASVAVLGASAYLGLSGRGDLDDLRSSCAPRCSDEEVDPVRRKLIISDVTFGVGLVGTAVALYLFLHP
jgi:hypothetical protein